MKKKQINLIMAAMSLLILLLAGCESPTWIIADTPPETPSEIPPFVITKPVVETYGRINYFNYAGIVFKFLNKADDPVDMIKVKFMLFDTETQLSPFIGSNAFEISKLDYIAPGENKEICISLDQFIYVAPTEPYLIDFFYISEVHFTSNIIWQDEYGKYRVRW